MLIMTSFWPPFWIQDGRRYSDDVESCIFGISDLENLGMDILQAIFIHFPSNYVAKTDFRRHFGGHFENGACPNLKGDIFQLPQPYSENMISFASKSVMPFYSSQIFPTLFLGTKTSISI